jgi:hypothetical protein
MLEFTTPGQEHEGRAGEGLSRRALASKPAPKLAADGPFPAERRPKRRKTSEVVTTIEMRISTMMIQVWSVLLH